MSSSAAKSFIDKRRAGVLLHPTSLPGPQFCGDLGPEAYRFIEWMALAGLSVWQMLPLNPTPPDGSPYQCQSSFAGNVALISIAQLVQDGWLDSSYQFKNIASLADLHDALNASFLQFETHSSELQRQRYADFCAVQKDWLDDWAMYAALKTKHNTSWVDWPTPIKNRDTAALAQVNLQLRAEIKKQKFSQFLFFNQWNNLKYFAAQRKIQLFGDLPIFVSHDSCDVWANPDLFRLDAHGQPISVAGVPPDYFSETGQRWGNPHYDWTRMQQDQFHWWRRRVEVALKLVDILRIDHFRGLEAYWEIPAHEPTAINGSWQLAPGKALLSCLQQSFDPLPIVAEDLGIITEAVVELRDGFNLPGMKILQFAFGGDAENPYLPHQHVRNTVVYTGTHDNNTLVGWLETLDAKTLQHVTEYLNCKPDEIAHTLIRSAFMSVADLAIIPLQDFLLLPEKDRMNTPGTLNDNNWQWRFNWGQIPSDLATALHKQLGLYARLP